MPELKKEQSCAGSEHAYWPSYLVPILSLKLLEKSNASDFGTDEHGRHAFDSHVCTALSEFGTFCFPINKS